MISHAQRVVEQTFGAKMAASENFLCHMYRILKKIFVDSPFILVLTVEQ